MKLEYREKICIRDRSLFKRQRGGGLQRFWSIIQILDDPLLTKF